MTITPDELKYLTKLNSAIATRKWGQGYALACALNDPCPRVTFIAEYKRRLRNQPPPLFFQGVEIVWDPADSSPELSQQSLDL